VSWLVISTFPHHHNLHVFCAVFVINLLAMGLKLGDRSQIGTLLLATSLVAVLQLLSAAVVWTTAVHLARVGRVPGIMESISRVCQTTHFVARVW
ncbi:MAG: DUF6394 family protein, partial [Acidiferrobacterales bacterium]